MIKFAFFVFSFGFVALADFAPFDHDIECKTSYSTQFKITYNKSEYTDLGRAGGIHLELNSGIEELSGMASDLGLKTSYRRIIRREGPAGQVGNWIEQDKKDPFVMQADLGFVPYQIISEQGEVEEERNSFISHITLSRVKSLGFHDSRSGLSEKEFLELVILDDFGTHHMRFLPKDCRLLN